MEQRVCVLALVAVIATAPTVRAQGRPDDASLKLVHETLIKSVTAGNLAVIQGLIHPQAVGFFRDSQQACTVGTGCLAGGNPADVDRRPRALHLDSDRHWISGPRERRDRYMTTFRSGSRTSVGPIASCAAPTSTSGTAPVGSWCRGTGRTLRSRNRESRESLMREPVVALGLAAWVAVAAVAGQQASPPAAANPTLTAVPGIKVGHHTLTERPTGCTVILVDGDGAAGGVSQRGGAPGTRETDLLDPANMVDKVNAVVLSGGSAFGLEAATGTVRWLEEHNIGWDVRIAKVPIVPAAILFDLPVGGNPKVRPTADCGYGGCRGRPTVRSRRDGWRRRRRDRRQDRRPGTLDEGGARELRHHAAKRPRRRRHRRRERGRRHHRSRTGKWSRASATRTGRSPTPASCCEPARRRSRRAPARTRPSAWWPPTRG